MDMHNNIVGANLFKRTVKTKCTLRVGYLIGNVCVTRKQYPASRNKLAEEVMKLMRRAVKVRSRKEIDKVSNNVLVYVTEDKRKE